MLTIRYRDIAAQLGRRLVTSGDFSYGVRRFVVGFGKKMLVANILAGPADRIFAMPAAELTAGHAWLGVTCYTLQIYFDFSGYSDMAVGLAFLLGFRFPQNFNSPFKAVDISDFWRRWHMSLSSWFRDYLFIPLGGSRRGAKRTVLNLVVVMALVGLWHGAAWTFVVWGLVHGFFLGSHAVLRKAGLTPPWVWLNRTITFLLVCAAFVIFRSPSLQAAGDILSSMLGLNGLDPHTRIDALLPGRFVLMILVLILFVNAAPNTWQFRLRPRVWYGMAAGVAAALAVMTIAQPHPFIYFQF